MSDRLLAAIVVAGFVMMGLCLSVIAWFNYRLGLLVEASQQLLLKLS